MSALRSGPPRTALIQHRLKRPADSGTTDQAIAAMPRAWSRKTKPTVRNARPAKSRNPRPGVLFTQRENPVALNRSASFISGPFHNRVDLVGDQAVRFAVYGDRRIRIGR